MHNSPDFNVVPMRDQNFVVRFRGPVSGIVLNPFFTTHVDDFRAELLGNGTIQGEYFAGDRNNNMDESTLLVGLYARAKMYRDVSDLIIARRFVP